MSIIWSLVFLLLPFAAQADSGATGLTPAMQQMREVFAEARTPVLEDFRFGQEWSCRAEFVGALEGDEALPFIWLASIGNESKSEGDPVVYLTTKGHTAPDLKVKKSTSGYLQMELLPLFGVSVMADAVKIVEKGENKGSLIVESALIGLKTEPNETNGNTDAVAPLFNWLDEAAFQTFLSDLESSAEGQDVKLYASRPLLSAYVLCQPLN